MKIFAANWKLNKNPEQTRKFLKDFLPQYFKSKNNSENKVVFFPPAINLESCSQVIAQAENSEFNKDSAIEFGSQNCFFEMSGAYTGENSMQTVKDISGKWILIGHSERRQFFSEADSLIAKKIKAAQELDLKPMLCIGENLSERESGKTFSVLENQIQQGLALLNKNKFISLAYEPVWAIGTGKVAEPQQVVEAHLFIRKTLMAMSVLQCPILYGGSVKSDNASTLIKIDNVDGFLVGGASLDVQSFLDICKA